MALGKMHIISGRIMVGTNFCIKNFLTTKLKICYNIFTRLRDISNNFVGRVLIVLGNIAREACGGR